MVAAHGTFVQKISELGGTLAGGEALAPPSTATSIRGASTVTDGPFLATKEAVNGYYVVEARDLDHAVEIAKWCPAPAPGGGVEIRPVVDPTSNPFWIAASDEPTASASQADAVAVALAQRSAQEAYVIALQAPTKVGVAERPSAWPTPCGRTHALNRLRREVRSRRGLPRRRRPAPAPSTRIQRAASNSRLPVRCRDGTVPTTEG